MNRKIDKIFDSLIPRGGETPACIYVSLEDYLSQLSNLNRKLEGVNHRMECWKGICEEHKMKFDSDVGKLKLTDLFKNTENSYGRNGYKLEYGTRDTRLENEFEVLLYSITSTLSALTRVVACFLKSSTDFHSHSKLSAILLRHKSLKHIQSIVENACSSWADELTARRDAATHYVALTITSSLVSSKSESSSIDTNVFRISISKKPLKYVSLWENCQLPILGGAAHKSIFYNKSSDDGREEHEILDRQDRIIVRRNSPLPNKPEIIDGEKFVQNLYDSFNEYVIMLLSSLGQVLNTDNDVKY